MNNENKKARLNVMDVLIILFILLCIGVFVYRALTIDDLTVEKNLEEYKLSFKVEKADVETYKALKGSIDKKVYVDSLQNPIGTLSMIGDTSSSKEVFDGVIYEYPDDDENSLFDFSGTIIVKGLYTSNGFMLFGEQMLAPNNTLSVSTEDATATIIVLNIEK